MLVGSIISI